MACDVVLAWNVVLDRAKVGVELQCCFVAQEVGFALSEIDHGVAHIGEESICGQVWEAMSR